MKIEFVSFSGEYPVLCFGTLTLLIDGKETTFGYSDHRRGVVYDHRPFWEPGGELYLNDNNDDDYVTQGEWTVNKKYLPEFLCPYAEVLASIMNENVPRGHCGG